MQNTEHSLCCGCLCSGRKMILLNDFWKTQCFLQILSEIPMCPSEGALIQLCWECEALITRFTKFKHQLQYSYKILQEFIKQNKDIMQLTRKPRLQVRTYNQTDEGVENKMEEHIGDNHVKLETDDWANADEVKNDYDDGYVDMDEMKVEFEGARPSGDEADDVTELQADGGVNKEPCLPRRRKVKRNKGLPGKLKKRKRKKPESFVSEVYKMIKLSAEEVAEERRVLAASDVYQSSSIKCERCIICYANVDDLNEHVVKKHDMVEDKLVCDICKCTFSNEVSYNYHTSKHYRRYECVACAARAPSVRAAVKHFDSNHSSFAGQYYCALCDIGFGSVEEMDTHRLSHNAEDMDDSTKLETEDGSGESTYVTYQCEYCDKCFKWKTSLNKHAEVHRIQNGQKRKPYCEPCRLTFTTTANLQKHVKTSSKHQIQLKLGKLKESVDSHDQTADKQQAVEAEIKNDVNTARNRFPCPHCDRRFQWKGNLSRHVQSHEAKAKGELVCVPCARSFSSIATYHQHMKISKKHVSEDDFKYMCSECGKKFSNKTLLKDHIDWEHLKNFVHKCPVCQKVFKSHTSLYLHKKVVHRRDDGDHLCDHCGKSFPNHAKLRTHFTAMHTLEQPYTCKLCTARFSWHSCLSRHVKVVHHKLKVNRKKRVKNGEVADE